MNDDILLEIRIIGGLLIFTLCLIGTRVWWTLENILEELKEEKTK